MISATSLASILKTLQSGDLKSIKPLVKLMQIEVLESLGEKNYLLKMEGKELRAFSKQPLQKGALYYAKLTQPKDAKPTLSHLLKLPSLLLTLKSPQNAPLAYDVETLKKVLKSETSLESFKTGLLHKLASSQTKEQFHALSNLLLSLHQNVLSFPVHIFGHFAFFQIKKRYNKKTKRSFLDFYAFFAHLGALSGVVDERSVRINVAYEEVAELLRKNAHSLPLELHVSIAEKIEPLFESNNRQILDIST